MVKERISASVEKETVDKINEILKNGLYRNKSHVIEAAIDLLDKNSKTKGASDE
jgi:Arc/MetJ-type ribon-helix-helix transcriptional regulator